MVYETKYAIISDSHISLKNQENSFIYITRFLSNLKNENVHKIIINGDITHIAKRHLPDFDEQINTSKILLSRTLHELAKSDMEIIISPGNHEQAEVYEPVMKVLEKKFSNITDAMKVDKIRNRNHFLVFMPGGDRDIGGNYFFGTEHPTGKYIKIGESFVKYENPEQFLGHYNPDEEPKVIYYKNVGDLERIVQNPNQTIVISHVPPRFSFNPAVDIAYYGINKTGKIRAGLDIEREILANNPTASKKKIQTIANNMGYSLRVENIGNKELKRIFDKLEITKNISGHCHDSVGIAHDENGNLILPKEESKSIFINSSYLKVGDYSIITVTDKGITYENKHIIL